MRKTTVIGVCFLTAIVIFLLASPHLLKVALYAPPRLDIFRIKERQTLPTITLYHVASVRTYQGSVTAFLQDCAKKFEQQNRGVYIQVEGVTEKAFAERLQNGRFPDAYSFFCGDLYPELLQQLPATTDMLLPGLRRSVLAMPYLFSGYVVCRNGSAEITLQESIADGSLAARAMDAARLSLCGTLRDVSEFKAGRCSSAITDLRNAGEILRNETLANIAICPLDTVTDQVCFFGVAKETEEEAALWLHKFLSYLLSDDVQSQLSLLGAFPVSANASPVYSKPVLQDMYESCREGVVSPDPFLWRANREKLQEDAVSAAAGDAYAQERFFERWAVVFGE